MDTWPWNILNQYCQDPTQRAWVSNQLRSSPIPPGQSPEDWLLSRSMVAEGMTEAEAWAQVHDLRGTQNQNQDQNQGQSQQRQQQAEDDANMFLSHDHGPMLGFSGLTNGIYQDHSIQQQQHHHFDGPSQPQNPFGFVSLQDVAPRPQGQAQAQTLQPRNINPVPNFYPGTTQILAQHQQPGFHQQQQLQLHQQLQQQQRLQMLIQQQQQQQRLNGNAGPGPSTSSLQAAQQYLQQVQAQSRSPQQYQPLPIDLTQLDSPPAIMNEIGQLPNRTESPIKLIPPGSLRTPSPSATYELSIQPGPSRKRSLVPVRPQDPARVAKKVRSDSSSIDRTPKSEPIDEKPKIGTSTFVTGTTSIDAVTMDSLRPLLTSESLTQPKPVPLFKNLRKREKKNSDIILPPLFIPTPNEVKEIASKIRDNASLDYLVAMASDDRYCEVWSSWLAKSLKDISKWQEALIPIFQVLGKTDMPMDLVEDTRIRIRAKKATDLAVDKNVANKDAIQSAFQRYDNYVVNVLIPKNKRSAPDDDDDDSNNKKRKIDQASREDIKPKIDNSSKSISSKVPGPSSFNSKPTVKPLHSSASSITPKAGSKSATDMSFFGSNPNSSSSSGIAGKGKGKLPEFKKIDRTSQPQGAVNPPAMSSLLQNALQALGAVSKTQPTTSIPSGSTAGLSTIVNQPLPAPSNDVKKEDDKPRYTSKGKLIRNVRFKDSIKPEDGGGALEQIKEFTQETYESELPPWINEDDVHGQSAHQLDVAEGAAMARSHGTIDWYEPIPYYDLPVQPTTAETEIQNERERGILAISYPPGIPVPDPSKSGVQVIEHNSQTRIMDAMDESHRILEYQSRGAYRGSGNGQTQIPNHHTMTQGNSVSDLLKGLQNVLPTSLTPTQSQHNPYAGVGNAHSYNNYYGNQQPPQQSWGQSQPSASYGDRPSWGGQNNYASSSNYDNRGMRPIDRDMNVPVCRFWSRGE
ncbi:uncharacterized protein IL334_000564 [Kwoniella shivajii]|uniref:Uncharacterized protein n=1 Tax=Kwoniella shivajii TaxID=564305 RepID=A0ABZ1CPG4_9TREE|nr:hypothetical protein IL334_000564 [Kwoniella shivajii]